MKLQVLLKKGQLTYLRIPKINSKALFTVCLRILDRSLFLNKYLHILILFLFFIPMYTNPTGLNFVPPFGPAIPVIEMAIVTLATFDKLLTIYEQH